MRLGGLRALLREFFGIIPTLDLHELGVRDAVVETERFVRNARAADIGCVRIVYGKGRRSPGGRGVLREVIPRWLETTGSEMICRYERRPDASGVDGAVVVWLKRPLRKKGFTADAEDRGEEQS